jgi:hypothetical protein
LAFLAVLTNLFQFGGLLRPGGSVMSQDTVAPVWWC